MTSLFLIFIFLEKSHQCHTWCKKVSRLVKNVYHGSRKCNVVLERCVTFVFVPAGMVPYSHAHHPVVHWQVPKTPVGLDCVGIPPIAVEHTIAEPQHLRVRHHRDGYKVAGCSTCRVKFGGAAVMNSEAEKKMTKNNTPQNQKQ